MKRRWAIMAVPTDMDQESQRPDSEDPAHGGGVAGVLRPRTLRSWLILAASLGLALSIYYGFLASSLVEYVAAWTASWTSAGLNLLGGSTSASGTILTSPGFTANIVAECTAVGPIVLFVGAVVAYPAPLRAKLVGAAIGLLAMTAVNVLRIMSLFWIGAVYPEYLDVAHLLVWQSAIVLLAIVMWLVWVGRVAGAARR